MFYTVSKNVQMSLNINSKTPKQEKLKNPRYETTIIAPKTYSNLYVILEGIC